MFDDLLNFTVFDTHIGDSEDATNDIIYCYSADGKSDGDENRRLVDTGILTAFIDFGRVFNTNSICDYILTDKREIALLPVGSDIFFSVTLGQKSVMSQSSSLSSMSHSGHKQSSIRSSSPKPKQPPSFKSFNPFQKHDLSFGSNRTKTCFSQTRKQLLLNSLTTIKNILLLNVEAPKRDPKTNKISDAFRYGSRMYIPHILPLINWRELSLISFSGSSILLSMFSSFFYNDLQSHLMAIQNQHEFIHGLILTNHKQIVASTTDSELSNLLAFLVLKKYHPYYPYPLTDKGGILHWTIGFSRNAHAFQFSKNDETRNDSAPSFINIVTPPLFWKGENYAIAALRYNKVRLIVIIKPKITNLDQNLRELCRSAERIIMQVESTNHGSSGSSLIDSKFSKISGAVFSFNFTDKVFKMIINRIQSHKIKPILNGITLANEMYVFIKKNLNQQLDSTEKNATDSSMTFSNTIRKNDKSLRYSPAARRTTRRSYHESYDQNLKIHQCDIPLPKSKQGFVGFDTSSDSENELKSALSPTLTDLVSALPSFESDVGVEERSSYTGSDSKISVPNPSGLIPLCSGFAMFFEEEDSNFSGVFYRMKQKNISDSIRHLKNVENNINS